MSLNPVVTKVTNLKIDWFHCIKSQKSSGSIEPFSKIEWFHGTTGTTTNASPDTGATGASELVDFMVQVRRTRPEENATIDFV